MVKVINILVAKLKNPVLIIIPSGIFLNSFGKSRIDCQKNAPKFTRILNIKSHMLVHAFEHQWIRQSMTTNKKGVSLTTRYALCFGEPCRDRTDNLLIKSQLLYRLS